MSEGQDPIGAESTVSGRSTWEFLEVLATVILAAESLRVIGSAVSGIIFATTAHPGPFGQQRLIGTAMVSAANFSDGPGIVLLLLSLGLLWWRTEYWTKQAGHSSGPGATPIEAIQLRRLRSLSRWASTLFTLAATGAVSFLVGNILVNTAGGVPTSDQWQAYASDSFSVAYLVIAVAGLVASLKLARLCELDLTVEAAG
jgi:hypothetical protein